MSILINERIAFTGGRSASTKETYTNVLKVILYINTLQEVTHIFHEFSMACLCTIPISKSEARNAILQCLARVSHFICQVFVLLTGVVVHVSHTVSLSSSHLSARGAIAVALSTYIIKQVRVHHPIAAKFLQQTVTK